MGASLNYQYSYIGVMDFLIELLIIEGVSVLSYENIG
jgi:hypothetical protein